MNRGEGGREQKMRDLGRSETGHKGRRLNRAEPSKLERFRGTIDRIPSRANTLEREKMPSLNVDKRESQFDRMIEKEEEVKWQQERIV